MYKWEVLHCVQVYWPSGLKDTLLWLSMGCNLLKIAMGVISLGVMGISFNNEGNEGNVLFNDALNTFYLRLMDHSDSERGNPLPPHGLLFPINSKGSFICTIPQTG